MTQDEVDGVEYRQPTWSVSPGLDRAWRWLMLIVLMVAAAPQRVLAENTARHWVEAGEPPIRATLQQFFPGADRFGAFSGKPPSAPVYHGNKVIGYFFRTKMVAPIPAYSGKPIDVLVGIDTKGRITGTRILEQHEPILLVGIPVQRLYDFVKQYIGKVATDHFVVGGPHKGGPDYVRVDAISSATVTSMVTNRTITAAAMKVAVARHLVAPRAGWNEPMARVRMNLFHPADWKGLVGNGSIRHLLVTAAEVNKAFHGVQGEVWHRIPKSGIYIDLYYAYLNAPTIGRNLLGKRQYDALMASLKPGEHAIVMMANGPFSFKGYGYVRGGIFDRVHLMQDNNLILFHDLDFRDLYGLAIHGAPAFQQRGIFIVRKNYGFDPGRPWTLQLLVRRQIGPIKSLFTTFNGGYRLPAAYYVRPPAPKQEPIWVAQWRAQRVQIAVLGVALALLTVVLFLQDYLVRRSVFLVRFRTVYLIFTLGFIGWYALGQLSVVNVLTFVNSLFHGFRWQTFLMAPMLFILWTRRRSCCGGAGCSAAGSVPSVPCRNSPTNWHACSGCRRSRFRRWSTSDCGRSSTSSCWPCSGCPCSPRAWPSGTRRSSRSRRRSRCTSYVRGRSWPTPQVWCSCRRSSRNSIADTCARWARRWRYRRGCGSSTGCGGARSAGSRAKSAPTSAKFRRSMKPVRSMPTSAITAWTAK